ncbi:MAG: L,D-transpeptidase family protein [Proteobacteria bacterium]|nr:L,D-transpeptidase family protein [Pseudomonadota bacterium]
MRFIFFLFFIISLNAKMPPEKANAATQALNTSPFIPKATMDGKAVGAAGPAVQPPGAAVQSAPKNSLKVLEQLQNVLNRLKPKEDEKFPGFAPTRLLHPSDRDDSIPNLRQILFMLGYLEKATDSPFFDMEVEGAVKTFQASHCLNADGIIGEDTKQRLNWSYAKRIKMLTSSIEKLSQLVFTDRTAIVNIPTYTLYAFEGNNFKMRMKIIVGRPDRPTPQMTSYINGVEFNPAWVVPHTILFKDKIPKIIEDPDYLEKNKLHVFDHDDEEVDPTEVNWEKANENDFKYTLKQRPGKTNALGRIRFILLNKEDIYLHDTPLRSLFKNCSRALSSGCIRLEKPRNLAAWLLDSDIKEIKGAIATKETETVSLEKNMTVYITYLPVWVEEDGKVLWGDDPYKLDPQPQT